MSNKIKYIIIMILAPLGLLAQDAKSHIRSGNKLYKAGDFAGAEVEYKKADKHRDTFQKMQKVRRKVDGKYYVRD